MTGVEDMNLCIRYIFAIAFRFARIERKIMFSPDHKQARLFLAHPCLPLGISLDVCAVVVEQIALNLRLTWLAQEGKLICPQVRVVALDVWIIANVPRARGG